MAVDPTAKAARNNSFALLKTHPGLLLHMLQNLATTWIKATTKKVGGDFSPPTRGVMR
jgi:hypothetical protein